jgi:uncharacterized lipoprotein YajG
MTMTDANKESAHVRKKMGKWGSNKVPHTGWECVDFQDLGEVSKKCEMCEAHEVRYVYYMSHKGYQGTLAVGEVCAGYMVGSPNSATRLKEMQLKAQARQAWLKHKWSTSIDGNIYHRTPEGYLVTLYDKGTHWEWRIQHEQTKIDKKVDKYSEQQYATSDDAKLAAYKSIQILIEEYNKWLFGL